MRTIWNKKSRLWKFTAVCLVVFEVIFLVILIFYYNTIGWSFLIPSGTQGDYFEYSQWYKNIYQPEHPNAEAIVSKADMIQVFLYWGALSLLTFLGRQESRQRSAWKKGLLELALYVSLMFGWFFLLLPRLTHYRLFLTMMPVQTVAIPLFIQLITHPGLPHERESE